MGSIDLPGILVRLLAPDAAAGDYNDWRFILTTTWPMFVLALLAAALLFAVASSAWGARRLGGRRRTVLLLLRACAAGWLLLLVLRPAIELRAVSRIRSRVSLLVDASRSMGLATEGGTRAEAVQAHLADNATALASLKDRALLEPMLFDEKVRPMETLPEKLPTDGKRTDIMRALSEVGWQSSGRDLGAVIIYSDGTDTAGASTEQLRRRAEKLQVPIYTIGFGRDSSAPDLAIRRVLADDFAFVHNTVTLDVEIEERGFDLGEVTATLKHDGTVINTKPVQLSDGRGRVSFEFKPRQIGKQVYQVSVPVQSGEVVDGNNSKSIVLKVIRDRIRVLQVAGRPSWDERFLREMLKRNPNIDLISFFILRSTTDQQKAPQDELALIPFPVNDLFTTELGSFDVVIYQNFTYRPYRMAHYLRNIREYVLKGGSFMMIGGDSSFEDGWYAGTPIADVLPVRLGGAAAWEPNEYRPRLTKKGRLHPITRIGEPGEPPEAAFRRLPKLAGFNASLGLAPRSNALLVHPSLPGNPPVVAVRSVGQGRTLAVATDSLWFWRFVAVGDGGAGREFDRFWSNALRWLIRDPELARVRVRADRSVVLLGDPVAAEVAVLGPDYRGLAGADVTAELLAVEGPSVDVLEAATGADGKAIVSFENIGAGSYKIRVTAHKDGERIGRSEEPIIVEASDVEYQAPFPVPETLRALASASGGAYADIGEPLPAIELNDPRRVEVDRTRQVPVWNTLVAFSLLLLFLGLEWWLRRRYGLL